MNQTCDPAVCAAPRRPLSEALRDLLENTGRADNLTLNGLFSQTDGRGLYLFMILLCLPFISPVPTPGLSNVFGIVIFVLSVRLALDLPFRLPRRFGNKVIRPDRMDRVLRAGVKTLRWIERWVRPRGTRWLSWRAARIVNAVLLALMALLLALPLPPIIPFSNSMPSYAIILLAISMMEEDGFLIWAGYGAVIVATAYLGVTARVAAEFVVNVVERFA